MRIKRPMTQAEKEREKRIIKALARVELEENSQVQEAESRAFIMGYYPQRVLGFTTNNY